MERRPRIYYSDAQKALMWERWRRGESLHQIAALFDRHHSSVRAVLSEPEASSQPRAAEQSAY